MYGAAAAAPAYTFLDDARMREINPLDASRDSINSKKIHKATLKALSGDSINPSSAMRLRSKGSKARKLIKLTTDASAKDDLNNIGAISSYATANLNIEQPPVHGATITVTPSRNSKHYTENNNSLTRKKGGDLVIPAANAHTTSLNVAKNESYMQARGKRRSVASAMRAEAEQTKYKSSMIVDTSAPKEPQLHMRNIPNVQYSTN